MSATREQVEIESRAQWRAWLAAHHRTSTGVWLVTYKKGGSLEWVLSAKRPAPRAVRVADTAASAAEGVRANQWRPPNAR